MVLPTTMTVNQGIKPSSSPLSPLAPFSSNTTNRKSPTPSHCNNTTTWLTHCHGPATSPRSESLFSLGKASTTAQGKSSSRLVKLGRRSSRKSRRDRDWRTSCSASRRFSSQLCTAPRSGGDAPSYGTSTWSTRGEKVRYSRHPSCRWVSCLKGHRPGVFQR